MQEILDYYKEIKHDFHLSVDYIMIVGKYFKTSQDFINIMKVNKKYNQLVEMYKYNPISDCSIFPNIETQHFYKKTDLRNVLPRMYRYIYWGELNKYNKAPIKNANTLKKYKFNDYDESIRLTDKMIQKDLTNGIIMNLINNVKEQSIKGTDRNKTLNNLNIQLGDLLYDSNLDSFNLNNEIIDKINTNDVLIEIFIDQSNTYLGILHGNKSNRPNFNVLVDSMLYKIPSLLAICYLDNDSNCKNFPYLSNDKNDNDYDCKLKSDSEKIYLELNKSKYLVFQTKRMNKTTTTNEKRLWLNINNYGLSYNELSNLMFKHAITSSTNPNLIKFLVKRHLIYSVKCDYSNDYYLNLLYKMNKTILFDSWLKPFIPDYNLGYLDYLYLDKKNNIVSFNIQIDKIIITTRINGKINVYKPLTDMKRFINNFCSMSLYNRYQLFSKKLLKYYSLSRSDLYGEKTNDILETQINDKFFPTRLLICTNELTKYSCMYENNYYINYKENSFSSF